MKKIILGLVVILGICALFFGGNAIAARSGGNSCDPSAGSDDQKLFPHGFICGTDGTATGPTYNAGWDSSTPPSGSVNEGSSITVRGGYTQSKSPPGPVLVWITVDGSPSVTDNSNIQTPYGGSKGLACPNHSGSPNNPGPVYGFRDLPTDAAGTYSDPAYDNQNRDEQSPYAYDRANNKGFVDCGTQGSMVYWTNAGESRSGYGLKINIPDDAGGSQVCVRLNISVLMPGESQWFPDRSGSQSPVQQHVAAAHIAKQSDRNCYNINSVTHPDTYTASFDANCGAAFGRLTQYNHAGTPTNANVAYVLQHWNPISNKWEDITAARSSVGRNWSTQDSPATGFNGDAYFGNGGAAAFRLVSLQFGILPNPATQPGGYIKSGLDCHDDPAVVDFTPTCHSVYLNAFYDEDGATISGAVNVYERVNGSRGWTAIGDGGGGRWVEYNQPLDQYNSGFDIYVGAYNRQPSGYGGGVDVTVVQQQGKTIGPCYAATCTLEASSPSTGLPVDSVEAGKTITVKATITNTGDGDNNPLYSNLGGNSLSITPGQLQPNSTGNGADNAKFSFGSPVALGTDIPLGESRSVTFNLTAPAGINTWTIDAYSDFYGRTSIIKGPTDQFGNPGYNNIAQHCSKSIKLYRHFTLTPHAAMVNFNEEDPTTVTYHTWITDDEHVNDSGSPAIGGVPASTDRKMYKLAPGPGDNAATTFDSGNDLNTRILTNTEYASPGAQPDHRRDYGTTGPIANPPNTYQAGDQYCARLHVDHSTGYIGPGDDLQVVAPATAHDCPHVVNRPYFKVLGGNISAGGQFSSSGTGCVNPAGEGILAGYNTNDNAGIAYDFGSSTEQTALAMQAITGVASGQTKYDKGTTRLSFSNTDNVGAKMNYSPSLGGNFNTAAGATSCLTSAEPDPTRTTYNIGNGAIAIPAAAAADKKVQFSHDNSLLIINASNIDRNVSIFTAGKVLIAGDLTYSGSGGAWNKDTVPSLEIHANDDIYIDSAVGILDGTFISEKSNGKISTCSTGNTAATLALMPDNGNYFVNCNKQLTIHGSFVADHINLMRTYGTLRNEKPELAGGSLGSPAHGQSIALYNYRCPPKTNIFGVIIPDGTLGKHVLSTSTTAPGYCNNGAGGTLVGYIATENAPSGSSEQMSQKGIIDLSGDTQYARGRDFFDTLIGYIPKTNTGGDNAGAIDIHVYTDSNGEHYYAASKPGGSDVVDNGHVFYLYKAAGLGGVPADPGSPPVLSVPTSARNCSNNGSGDTGLGAKNTFTRLMPGSSSTRTCASEVFDFSPEQYLSHPAIAPPNLGAPVWDSVTSLPPVL